MRHPPRAARFIRCAAGARLQPGLYPGPCQTMRRPNRAPRGLQQWAGDVGTHPLATVIGLLRQPPTRPFPQALAESRLHQPLDQPGAGENPPLPDQELAPLIREGWVGDILLPAREDQASANAQDLVVDLAWRPLTAALPSSSIRPHPLGARRGVPRYARWVPAEVQYLTILAIFFPTWVE